MFGFGSGGVSSVHAFVAKSNVEDLRLLKDLIEAGKLVPMLDRTFWLSEAAEALRYMEEKQVQGKVVLAI